MKERFVTAKEHTLYVIKGIDQVNYLVRKGHDIVKLASDKEKRGRKIFLFINTLEFQEDLKEYYKIIAEQERW